MAPFYYKVADSLATYVELNLDEMNQLKSLELPDDPDEIDIDEQEELAQEEGHGDEVSDTKDAIEPTAEGQKAEDSDPEPIIADVIDSTSKPTETKKDDSEAVKDDNKNDNNELEELTDDIFTNFQLANQMIDDFRTGYNLMDQSALTDAEK